MLCDLSSTANERLYMTVSYDEERYKKIYQQQRKIRKFTKVFFALLSIGSFVSIMAFIAMGFITKKTPQKIDIAKSIDHNLVINTFSLTRKYDNNELVVNSERAIQNRHNPSLFFLEKTNIDFHSLDSDAQPLRLSFQSLLYDKENMRLYSTYPFYAQFDNNISIKGENVEILLGDTQVSLKDITLYHNDTIINADIFTIDEEVYNFYGNVKVKIPDTLDTNIYLESDTLRYYYLDKKLIFIDNSHIKTQQWQLQAQNIIVENSPDQSTIAYTKLYAINDTKLTNKQGVFKGNYLFYDRNEHNVHLKGKANLKTKKLTLKADEVLYDLKEEKVILSQKLQKKPVEGKIQDIFQ